MPEAEWNSTSLPQKGEIVRVLAKDIHGQYVIPFPVVFRNDTWWNASTGALLEADILGWRLMTPKPGTGPR